LGHNWVPLHGNRRWISLQTRGVVMIWQQQLIYARRLSQSNEFEWNQILYIQVWTMRWIELVGSEFSMMINQYCSCCWHYQLCLAVVRKMAAHLQLYFQTRGYSRHLP
jgi:hypothetical protein